MALIKLACVVVMCMVVVGAPVAQAITCSQVSSNLGSCMNYLKGSGGLTPGCCSGIKSLNSAAQTTADRQQACQCLKTAASSISGINYSLAQGLPEKCGVNIPYKISPSTDCKTVK